MVEPVEPLGERIVKSMAQAKSRVALVAPFIKRAALQRVLATIPPGVTVSCYTRWRPEEIAAGVSDLEVWPLLRARQATLRLRYDLHAKVFCADKVCFVGSANITAAALGWAQVSNLELLVPICADHESLVPFFQELDERTVEVTDAIHAEMLDVVKGYPVTSTRRPVIAQEEELGSVVGWVPRCRVPGNHNLYRTYTKQWNMVNSTTYEDAKRDLDTLGIPGGIESELTFLKYVTAVLRQSPIVALVAERARDRIRPEEGQRLITREFGYGNGPQGEVTGEEWATLRTWITTFLTDEFRERHGDSGPELVRGMRIA